MPMDVCSSQHLRTEWPVSKLTTHPTHVRQFRPYFKLALHSPRDAVAHEPDVASCQALPGLLTGQAAQPAAEGLPEQVPGVCVPEPANSLTPSTCSPCWRDMTAALALETCHHNALP